MAKYEFPKELLNKSPGGGGGAVTTPVEQKKDGGAVTTTTTSQPVDYGQWLINTLGHLSSRAAGAGVDWAKNKAQAVQSAYENMDPIRFDTGIFTGRNGQPYELTPRSLSDVGRDVGSAALTFGNAYTGDVVPTANQVGEDTGFISPERAARARQLTADAAERLGPYAIPLQMAGYTLGPGKILGPLTKGLRVAATPVQGAITSGIGAYSRGENWPDIARDTAKGALYAKGGELVGQKVIAPVVKKATELAGGSTPENFTPGGAAPTQSATPTPAAAPAAAPSVLEGQEAANWLQGQKGSLSEVAYNNYWNQLVASGKINTAGVAPPPPQSASAPNAPPNPATDRAKQFGQWHEQADIPAANVPGQAAQAMTQPGLTDAEKAALRPIATSGGEGSPLLRKSIAWPFEWAGAFGGGAAAGAVGFPRTGSYWGGKAGRLVGDEVANSVVGLRGPEGTRAAIEAAYPAYVGSSPASVINSQQAQEALRNLILSQGMAGQLPGVPLPSLPSVWGQ